MTSDTVALVVDTSFGERLHESAARLPIWVIDTPINRSVAKRIWDSSSASQVTTFLSRAETPEECCLGIIGMLDLHHNECSQASGYTVLEVYGASLTEKIKDTFAEFGFVEFLQTSGGFIAKK